MAQRTGCDHRIRATIARSTGVVRDHPQRVALINEQYREAATRCLAGKIRNVRPRCLNDRLQRGLSLRILIETERIGRTHDVAAVERREVDARELLDECALQSINPDVFNQHPEEMLNRRVAVVLESFIGERGVDLCQVFGVSPHAMIGLRDDSLACGADGQDWQSHFLCHGERPDIQRVAQFLVLLLQDTSARARSTVHFDPLDAETVHDSDGRVEQLRARSSGNTTGVEGELHRFDSGSILSKSAVILSLPSALCGVIGGNLPFNRERKPISAKSKSLGTLV